MGSQNKDLRHANKRLTPPQLELLFEASNSVGEPLDLGPVASGHRMIGFVDESRFEGPRISGRFLPGSSFSQLVHPNGVIDLEGHLALETDDGHHVFLRTFGLVSLSPEAAKELAEGRPYDPDMLYIRACARCETDDNGPYSWLNRTLCVIWATRSADAIDVAAWQLL